ncbi:MFS general substrate transporter [Meredithblackwellia eburnea MCA 4105]
MTLTEKHPSGDIIVQVPPATCASQLPLEAYNQEALDGNTLKDVERGSDDESNAGGHLVFPWRYKWFALLLAAFLPLGSTWTESALGPLKNTLRNELGMCLDWFGVNTITLVCTSNIFVGAIIAALSANTGKWRMLVGGHIMMGFGTAVLDSAQHKLFYHYFGTGGLAFAFGVEQAFNKLIGMSSGFSTIPLRDATGWWGWSFWIPTVLCGLSFLVNIGYVIWERRYLPTQYRMTPGRTQALRVGKKSGFSFKVIMCIPWAFWMLPITQIFQSEAAGAFGTSSSDLIRMKGYTEEVSAYTANAKNVFPLVLAPLMGLAVDRWGKRLHLITIAPLLWITACAVIGWSDVHPLLPVIISSLASAFNAFPFQITIPLLLRDQDKLGTAFGVWRCFNNSGGTIMGIVYGIVQDRTDNMAYTNVLVIGIAFKAFAFFLGLFYMFVDYKHLGGGMAMGEKQRLALEDQIKDPESDPLTRRTAKNWVTYVGLGLLFSMMVTAWTIFIRRMYIRNRRVRRPDPPPLLFDNEDEVLPINEDAQESGALQLGAQDAEVAGGDDQLPSSTKVVRGSSADLEEKKPAKDDLEGETSLETALSPIVTPCGHLFCWACCHEWFTVARPTRRNTCPVCHAGNVSEKTIIPIYSVGGSTADPRTQTLPPRPHPVRLEPSPAPTRTTRVHPAAIRNQNEDNGLGRVTFHAGFPFTGVGFTWNWGGAGADGPGVGEDMDEMGPREQGTPEEENTRELVSRAFLLIFFFMFCARALCFIFL